MSYYERFRGNYDEAMRLIETRRQAVIDEARKREPENFDELLSAAEDGEFDYDLEWVDVPNPWRPESDDVIKVRPILSCAEGYPDAEREKDRSDKGVWQLSMEARLPSGDIRYMGFIMFFYTDGRQKSEPMIAVNMDPDNQSLGTHTRWDSADAELFLTLAESALAAQPE